MAPAGTRALDSSRTVSEYAIEVWGADRGLDVFAIHVIHQSADGFLWLGTGEGLIRFDGLHFVRFDRSNTPELSNDNVTSIVEDASGVLWVGTRGGGLISYSGREFRRFSRTDGLPSDSINCLLNGADGSIWIGFDQGEIGRRSPEGYRRLRIPPPGSLGINAIVRTGGRYVASSAGELFLPAGGGADTFRMIGLQPMILRTLYARRSGDVWVGTSTGLQRLDPTAAVRSHQFSGEVPDMPVTAMLDDRNGNFWIGTEGGGLFRFTDGRGSRLSLRDGLSSDRILALCEDREGNLWVGTRGGGLVRLRDNTVSMIGTGEGLSDEFVTSVLEARDGALWLGTRGGGLNEVRPPGPDGRAGRVIHYTTKDGLPDNLVRSIVEDSRGSIWAGLNGSVVRLDPRAGGRRSIRVYADRDGVPPFSVRALHVDRTGVLWLGSYGGGVLRLVGGRFVNADPEMKAIPVPYVRTIVEDSAGTVWVGSQAGVARASRAGGGGAGLEAVDDGGLLSPNVVFSMLPDTGGTIWIGTFDRGLFRLTGGVLAQVRKSHGLFDDVVYSILDDGLGGLWMSSNRGIFSVARRDLEEYFAGRTGRISSRSFGTADGMASQECNGATQPAGWRARDGRLLFPTVKGLASLHPARLRPDELAPLVRIDLAVADADTIDPWPAAVLSAGTQRLEIGYTGLNFSAPEKVRFRFRLDGFDRAWVDAGQARKASYTNIPPGEYIFRVMASNSEGVWSEQAATVSVILPPKLWETWWFRGGLIVALIGSGWYGVRRRERGIKAAERARHEISAQMLELESRALRARMNPHFLFNALNAVQERVLSGNIDAACAYLSTFARLLRMILDHSGKSVVPLDQDLALLRLYVDIESVRFDRGFSARFDVDPALGLGPCMVPPMLLQPFVENAIWHGLAGKEGERVLTISASTSGEMMHLSVEDNGIGRAQAAAHRGDRPRSHESKGISLTRERIAAMNAVRGGNGTAASLEIVDLADSSGRPAGTRVELKLPLL